MKLVDGHMCNTKHYRYSKISTRKLHVVCVLNSELVFVVVHDERRVCMLISFQNIQSFIYGTSVL